MHISVSELNWVTMKNFGHHIECAVHVLKTSDSVVKVRDKGLALEFQWFGKNLKTMLMTVLLILNKIII